MTLIWMRITAEYVHALRPTDSPESVAANIRETYTFLADKAVPFLNQFDTTAEGDDE